MTRKHTVLKSSSAHMPASEIAKGAAAQRSKNLPQMAIDHAAPVVLGDSMLDRDHAELSRLVQALLTASGAAALAALDGRSAEAGEHFEREDADLHRLGGNNATCHLDEHAAVLLSLDEVRAILCAAQTPPEMAQRLVTSLARELQRWLPEHVSEMDASLATVRCRSRFGGAPLRLVRAERLSAHASREFRIAASPATHESKL